MNAATAQKILQQTRIDYDRIAGHYAQTRANSARWPQVRALIKQYVRAGDHVLELGCGNGRVANFVSESKAHYVGLDASVELIKLARAQNQHADFRVGNMLHPPFADHTFNSILMIASFHHIPSADLRAQMMREVARLLKPDGCLIMTNWNLRQTRFWWPRLQFAACRFKHLLKCLNVPRNRTDAISSADDDAAVAPVIIADKGAPVSTLTTITARDLERDDLLIPWKDAQGQVLAQRYYHSCTPRELSRLARATGLTIIDQYYESNNTRRHFYNGQNLVTIMQSHLDR